jgi:ATP-binding cassette subfamily B multidrug efflux pump
MDRLIVLDQGRIVEEGTHDELLRRDGHYAKLWKHQSGGFLPNDAPPLAFVDPQPVIDESATGEMHGAEQPEPNTSDEPPIKA